MKWLHHLILEWNIRFKQCLEIELNIPCITSICYKIHHVTETFTHVIMSFTVYGTCYLDWMHVIMHLRYRDTLTLSVIPTRHHWSQLSEYFSNNSLATGHHVQSTPDIRNVTAIKLSLVIQMNYCRSFDNYMGFGKFRIFLLSIYCKFIMC